jgi:hypothetical protein
VSRITAGKAAILQFEESAFSSMGSPSIKSNLTKFLFPSASDLIFMVLLFSFSCGALAPRLLQDAGTGWHIRNGELILSRHSITRTDPFSSTMQGKPWYAWEWLYDVGIGLVHRWAGLNGVVFVSALIIALTFTWMFRLALRRGGTLAGSLLLSLLAICAASIHFLARPHVVSWLLTLLWFYLLDSSETDPQGARRLFWLPFIMLLWVNVHGGFLVGFVLLAIYLVPNLLHFLRTRAAARREIAAKRCRRLSLVLLLSLLATLVNPYGYKLHLHLFGYLSNRFLMDHINEFQSPNFHGFPQQAFLLLCLIAVAALAAWRISISLADLLIVLFAIASGLYASRSLPTSAILLTLVIAPLLTSPAAERSDAEPQVGTERNSYWQSLMLRLELLEKRVGGHLWPALAFLFLAWVCSSGGMLAGRSVMASKFSEKRFPVKAVDFVQTHKISGPIFTPDDWGGYLIYRLYPEQKVVTDDRHDLYGEQFFKDYSKLTRVEGGWQSQLENKHITAVLLPAGSPLDAALEQRPEWNSIYRDETSELLLKK